MDIHLDIHGFIWICMHGLAIDSRSRGSNVVVRFFLRRLVKLRWFLSSQSHTLNTVTFIIALSEGFD